MSARKPREVPVIATHRFVKALDSVLDFYADIAHLHPDAGSRAVAFIDWVESELPRRLATQPDIGRPAQLTRVQSEAESRWLAELAPLTASRRLQAREWFNGGFWVLYFRIHTAVYLVSARHERESSYR